MIYSIQWHEDAITDLKNLDRNTQKKIIARVKDYLSKDPLSLGKPLKGIFKGLYRYRYGSYRVIYAIDRNAVLLLILRIGNRNDVYENQINEK